MSQGTAFRHVAPKPWRVSRPQLNTARFRLPIPRTLRGGFRIAALRDGGGVVGMVRGAVDVEGNTLEFSPPPSSRACCCVWPCRPQRRPRSAPGCRARRQRRATCGDKSITTARYSLPRVGISLTSPASARSAGSMKPRSAPGVVRRGLADPPRCSAMRSSVFGHRRSFIPSSCSACRTMVGSAVRSSVTSSQPLARSVRARGSSRVRRQAPTPAS